MSLSLNGITRVAGLLLIGTVLGHTSAAQTLTTAEKTALLERMNGVYYNAASQNFKGMQCSVESDWAGYFSRAPELKDKPESQVVIQKAVAKLSTQLTVGANGHAKAVTTGTDTSAIGEALDTTTNGMNQSIQGFFLQWAAFALEKPFPYKPEDIELKPTDEGYTLTKTMDDGTSEMQLTKDLALQNVKVDTTRMKVDEELGFVALGGGLALNKMIVDMEMKPSSKLPTAEIDATYQTLGGIEVPNVLTLHLEAMGLQPVVMTLTNCKLTQ